MADAGIDIAQLTEDQQLALQQFIAVTDQAPAAAVPLLQRCQWNVQIAIARFFDGEPATDPVAEASSSLPPPQDPRRQETLLNGFSSAPRSSSSSNRRFESAPRIVPQPESQITNQAPLLLTILFTPFSLVYSLLSKYFRFVGYLFPILPRTWTRLTAGTTAQTPRRNTSGRRPLNTRDTAARFIREFEEEYGSHELPFFENGYAQAFDLAKKELKYLMIVLVSPEHDMTTSFVRETLLAPDVVNFIKDPENKIILWAGNVQDSEAFQVSAALNCTKFPFTSLIAHTPQVSSTSMGIAIRIAGPTPPGQYIAKLQQGIQAVAEPLNRVRAQRAELQASRNLRESQNSAYERSLALDRERARQKREAEERKAREEKEALDREAAKEKEALNLAQWRKWRATSIADEPGPDVKDVVRISLRMPSGNRIVRKFAAEKPIEELYAFVECYDILQSQEPISEKVFKPDDFEHEYKFKLVSPMPREAYELSAGGSIKDRIGRSGNLIVERTEDDDDEGEIADSD
ncbi:UBX domain-containing protein [Mytilinidion resinicola]|uniref:UBX domain-containing protein n=1 Tax=Mytilinidion resinicola TaxID=574789 RepID=A0A6A6Z4V6_9PEZI|nr:UBX domain-containing protein [Mytilinidion resinicola]KAF2816106.1 UBX domain-containing protein [Mytilinidion resinicola]